MRHSVLIILVIVFNSLIIHSQDFTYDKEVGAEGAKQVESMMGLYEDSTLNNYINSVGYRLVDVLQDPPVDFRFHVIDDNMPNAFALPGGYIYVTRGIISLLNDESELACVLGHEMIHVTKRHSVKQMKKGILPGLLRLPGALVGIVNPNLGKILDAPLALGSDLYMANYSRGQEKEADRYGVKLASDAGYDPTKLSVILNRLSIEVENVTGEAEKKSYLSTHPYTPKREEYLTKEIEKLDWTLKPAIADNRESLYENFDGMYYGQNPRQGIFQENTFKQPDMDFAITFPEKWETVNVPVAVGAYQADGKAQIVVGLDDPESTPDSLGLAFAEQIKKEYNMTPKKSKPVKINDFPAYIVTFEDNSGGQVVEIQNYWIMMDSLMFNIIGLCFLEYSETISNSIRSLRQLTKTEKSEITCLRVRLAQANNNESIEELSTRTKNKWDKKTTILLNGLDDNEKLKSGQVLKIAVEEPYFSHIN